MDPYKKLYETSGLKELDLRKELRELLDGSWEEIPKGRIGYLRKVRLDENENPIRCKCRDRITDEPDEDYYCPKCLGIGYLWDEEEITFYRNDNSFRKVEGKTREFPGDYFYVKYTENITTNDYIVIINNDKEGKTNKPIKRFILFDIISADEFRCDNGRIEYWRIRAKEKRKWSIRYGIQNRQHN